MDAKDLEAGYPLFAASGVPIEGQGERWSAIWGGSGGHRGQLQRVEVTNVGKVRAQVGPAGAPGTMSRAKAIADLSPGASQVWTVPAGQPFLQRNPSSNEGTSLQARVDRTWAPAPSFATWRQAAQNVSGTNWTLPPQGLLNPQFLSTVAGTLVVQDPDGPLAVLTLPVVAATLLPLPDLGGDLLVQFTTGGGPGTVALLGRVVTL